jgi:hypothetical protein
MNYQKNDSNKIDNAYVDTLFSLEMDRSKLLYIMAMTSKVAEVMLTKGNALNKMRRNQSAPWHMNPVESNWG